MKDSSCNTFVLELWRHTHIITCLVTRHINKGFFWSPPLCCTPVGNGLLAETRVERFAFAFVVMMTVLRTRRVFGLPFHRLGLNAYQFSAYGLSSFFSRTSETASAQINSAPGEFSPLNLLPQPWRMKLSVRGFFLAACFEKDRLIYTI